jgi:hypothetical protein
VPAGLTAWWELFSGIVPRPARLSRKKSSGHGRRPIAPGKGSALSEPGGVPSLRFLGAPKRENYFRNSSSLAVGLHLAAGNIALRRAGLLSASRGLPSLSPSPAPAATTKAATASCHLRLVGSPRSWGNATTEGPRARWRTGLSPERCRRPNTQQIVFHRRKHLVIKDLPLENLLGHDPTNAQQIRDAIDKTPAGS